MNQKRKREGTQSNDDPVINNSPSESSSHGVVAARPLSDTQSDVFLSFRGIDIRANFLSHLIEAFKGKTVEYSADDQIKEGYDVWSSLATAIEGSFISLVIFSENYACSDWCLEELAKILECSQKYGQTIIPVFYKVQPTFVRHQSSERYIEVFEKLEEKHPLELVENWRDVMKKAANKLGIVSTNFRTDAEVVKKIVEAVDSKLCESSKHLVNSNGLVGFENRYQRIMQYIRDESKPVRVIGIWGQGGLGKTTIAGEVFNQLHPNKYRSGCFFPDLKNEFEEKSKYNRNIISFKKELCKRLLDKKDDVKIESLNGLPASIKRMIGRRKALIVLDDVNDLALLVNIFGPTLDWLKSGSRIILTSRDKQVLIANGVEDDNIYRAEELSSTEALQLFKLKAFSQNNHDSVDYEELSKRVVNYAGGIPLVLEVLGGLLRGKDQKFWKGQLQKLEKIPNEKVYDSMKLSYEDLDPQQKRIFLDLACILCDYELVLHECNRKVDYIKDMLKDKESDDALHAELVTLEDKALITISEDLISMHDIIKEMGQEIVRRESIEHPEKRSHLRDQDDISKVLESNQGTKAIRSIFFLKVWHTEMKLSRQTFANMTELRYLVLDLDRQDCFEEPISFPSELRYLRWNMYPLNCLPDNFSAESLVILDLSYSEVEKLWPGVLNLVNLKSVNLCHCSSLEKLPSFSKAKNLEVLNADNCESLTEVHPSILSLEKLQTLNLGKCKSLSGLVSSASDPMSSLRTLNLQFCKKLTEFSVISKNMVELGSQYTQVNALPSSFGCQVKLEFLDLRGCKIESLPSSIAKLTKLRYLNLMYCKKLRTISDLPPSLENLFVGYRKPGDQDLLKTVSFPSEGIKSMRRAEFWNCLTLDKDSPRAIEWIAQDSIKYLACQHLSNCAGNNFDDYKYVYPGSIVPNWFSYKTTKDPIIIDLSSSSGTRSAPLGFIFCFVVYRGMEHGYRRDKEVAFDVTISDCEDKGISETATMSICGPGVKMGSDHVCVMYDEQISCYLNSKAKDLNKFQIHAKLRHKHPRNKPILRGFGICRVSPETIDN